MAEPQILLPGSVGDPRSPAPSALGSHNRWRDCPRSTALERVTSQPAVMWGPSMVGFGSSALTNTLGTNDWFDIGYSPRKAAMTIYGIYDEGTVNPLLAELGPHTTGKACLYLKRLDDIDLDVLERLFRDAWTVRNP